MSWRMLRLNDQATVYCRYFLLVVEIAHQVWIHFGLDVRIPLTIVVTRLSGQLKLCAQLWQAPFSRLRPTSNSSRYESWSSVSASWIAIVERFPLWYGPVRRYYYVYCRTGHYDGTTSILTPSRKSFGGRTPAQKSFQLRGIFYFMPVVAPFCRHYTDWWGASIYILFRAINVLPDF